VSWKLVAKIRLDEVSHSDNPRFGPASARAELSKFDTEMCKTEGSADHIWSARKIAQNLSEPGFPFYNSKLRLMNVIIELVLDYLVDIDDVAPFLSVSRAARHCAKRRICEIILEKSRSSPNSSDTPGGLSMVAFV
jgi:hypothetical protein